MSVFLRLESIPLMVFTFKISVETNGTRFFPPLYVSFTDIGYLAASVQCDIMQPARLEWRTTETDWLVAGEERGGAWGNKNSTLSSSSFVCLSTTTPKTSPVTGSLISSPSAQKAFIRVEFQQLKWYHASRDIIILARILWANKRRKRPQSLIQFAAESCDIAVCFMSKEKYYKMGSTQRSKLIAVIDEGTNSARFAVSDNISLQRASRLWF